MADSKYAGFWIRFGAALLDALVVLLPTVILLLILTFTMGFVGMIIGYAIMIIVDWLYGAGLESSSKQATLGKQAIDVKVVDYKGKRITFARATGRHFAKILSGMILLIGYIMVGFTDRKQGLHDFIASTYVVKR